MQLMDQNSHLYKGLNELITSNLYCKYIYLVESSFFEKVEYTSKVLSLSLVHFIIKILNHYTKSESKSNNDD